MHRSILIENISFSRYCDIETTNAKSITEASTGTWVMFISKYSDILEIEHSHHSSLPTPHCGFHSMSTDLADKSHS